jgi:hypothetical protein
VPFGYGFTLVSCPNYFFEIVGWIAIAVMTGSIAGMSSPLIVLMGVAHVASPSMVVYCLCYRNNVHLGVEETQKLQQGVWKGVPQGQKGHHPVYSVVLLSNGETHGDVLSAP